MQKRCRRDNNSNLSALLATPFLVLFSRQGSLAKGVTPQNVAAVALLLVLCEKPTYAAYVRKRERPVWMDTEPLPGSALGGNL